MDDYCGAFLPVGAIEYINKEVIGKKRGQSLVYALIKEIYFRD